MQIFEDHEARAIKPLVMQIVESLRTTLRGLHLILRRREAEDPMAELPFRELRGDLLRHVRDAEALGACVRNPGQVKIVLPGIRSNGETGFWAFDKDGMRWEDTFSCVRKRPKATMY